MYTEHAVNRMTPNGLGGRGIPTIAVENAIAFGKITNRLLVQGGVKYTKIFQNVKVVYKRTIDGREVIITVIKLSSKGK